MKVDKNIPEISFQSIHNKSFEFQIVGNKEILLNQVPNRPDLFRPHRINFYAILFILEGEGKHFIDFKSYDYKKGSIIFISKEQVQAFEKNEERKASFLLFTENFIERGSLNSSLMQQLSLYNYHLYSPVVQLKENEMAAFESLVERIKIEYEAPDDNLTEEIIQSSLKIFLGMAERIRKKNRAAFTPSKYQSEFIDFQKLLNQNLFSTRQVQFYAQQMGMSTKKLNRITQEVTSKPSKSYISDILILEIKRFLINTSLSIKEISYKTGFEDPTNFVKFFKKYAGSTPIDFRNKH